MAKRTKTISFVERIRSWRSSRAKRSVARNWNWVAVLKVTAVICFFAASGAFLRYAEAYVKTIHPAGEGPLVLVNVPEWVKVDLMARVTEAAGDSRFPLEEETASVLARNLAPMAWLDDVNIRVTHDSVRVKARWRKPIAVIDIPEDRSKIYVDPNLVVLNYMPMPHLPIVEIKGVDLGVVPLPGQPFDRGDVAAAVELIVLLQWMDANYTPKNPLLEYIASIDVSNYKGRKYKDPKKSQEPHIVLHTKDDTQIIWGAEKDEWSKCFEAADDEKLARLYTHYRDFGSLSAKVKYINLRDPQDTLPQPIDKYRY